MKNLDNNVRLRKYLEQSVNQLGKILEKMKIYLSDNKSYHRRLMQQF